MTKGAICNHRWYEDGRQVDAPGRFAVRQCSQEKGHEGSHEGPVVDTVDMARSKRLEDRRRI